jgi:hypothetical protein
MHGSRSKIPSKNIVGQRCAEGFNSGAINATARTVSDEKTSLDVALSCIMNGLFISFVLSAFLQWADY